MKSGPKQISKIAWTALLGGMLVLALSACGEPAGVTAEEAEQLRAQVSDVEQRLGNIEAVVGDIQDTDAAAREELAAEVREELEQMRAMLDSIAEELEPPPEPEIEEPADPLAPPGP